MLLPYNFKLLSKLSIDFCIACFKVNATCYFALRGKYRQQKVNNYKTLSSRVFACDTILDTLGILST